MTGGRSKGRYLHKPHIVGDEITVHYRFHPLAGQRVTGVERRSWRGNPVPVIADAQGVEATAMGPGQRTAAVVPVEGRVSVAVALGDGRCSPAWYLWENSRAIALASARSARRRHRMNERAVARWLNTDLRMLVFNVIGGALFFWFSC